MKVSFEGRRERDDDAEQRRGNKYLTTREPTMAIIYGWRIGKKKKKKRSILARLIFTGTMPNLTPLGLFQLKH